MGLIIKDIENKEFSLSPPKFLSEEKVFSLEFSEDIIKIPYALQVEQTFSTDAFDVYLFVNSAVQENDIFRVYEGESEGIIGWLFSIQALLSTEHDYANDPHFLPCAFVAFQKLLQGDGFPTKTPIFKGEQLSILDFYNDNDCILLLGRNEINRIRDFQLKFYLPNLFKYGYRYKDKLDTESERMSKYYAELKKNIKLYKISEKLKNNTYIYDLFTYVLEENNVVHAFLSLYQVIEIIIFDIFKDGLGKCFENYSRVSENNCDRFFEIGEELTSITKEKPRIIKLFTNLGTECSNLQSLCNNLLNKMGFESGRNAASAIYAVRNNLVHSYRLFSIQEKEHLRDIVEEFIGVVVDILIAYKK